MEAKGGVQFTGVKSEEEGIRLMNRLVDVAQPESVFGEPITVGDYTLITTSAVSAGLGYGFGGGYGPTPQNQEEGAQAAAGSTEGPGQMVGGSGGGGGGFSTGRPVAVISVGPDGVRVEPVVDLTKIGLAIFSTMASMIFAMGRVRRMSRH